MLLALLGSLYPVPAYPLNLLPYIFLIYMCCGAVWFFVLRSTSPTTLHQVEHDLEVAEIATGAKIL